MAIVDDVLSQAGSVPQARAIMALEGDIAAWEAGIDAATSSRNLYTDPPAHPISSDPFTRATRIALPTCWRHHLVRALHSLTLPHYRLLLTERDPELGKHFWPLLLAADLATEQTLATLKRLGDPASVAELLDDPEPATRMRAAQALAAIENPDAIPALTTALDAERDRAVAVMLEHALSVLERLPAPLLDVRLMGSFEVLRDGVPLPQEVWPRPIVRRLLQYFAVHRGIPTRDRILDDLWPDVDRDSAWTTFRTVYSRLRSVLEPSIRPKATGRYFDVTSDSYCFDPHNRVRVDIETFKRLVRSALDAAEQQDVPALSTALLEALVDWAPLLPNMPYEEWLLAPREHLQTLYIEGCLYVAQAYLVHNQLREAIAWAERAVTAAPWLEEGYQALMRAHARLGQRSLARKAYTDAICALEREVGVGTSDLTRWLAERLEHGEEI